MKPKEFMYYAYVAIVGMPLPIRYESGWWSDQSKAKDEIEGILESHLPAGIYDVSLNLKER